MERSEMHELADYIDAQRSEVIERWKLRVRNVLTPPGLTEGELVDHLPQVLDELTRALRGDHVPPRGAEVDHSRAGKLAKEHGRQRYRNGFDLRELVREYGALRDCLLEILREGGLALSVDDVVLIGRFITDGISESVSQYVEDRDAELLTRNDFEQQLIGIVSHDLRNPIGAVQLAAETLLARKDLDERQAKTVSRISSSSKRANRLIADLLDFTAARLGQGLTIERKALDIHRVVRDVVDEIRLGSEERALRIETRGDGAGEWDEERIAQIITNLVSNALAYGSDDAPIIIHTRGEGDDVVLCVHNEGAAIPSELLPRLFDPLMRGTSEVSKSGRSIGLGLYIVDQIVRAHGGTVDVRSTDTEGTAFTVHLPRRASGAT